MRREQGPRRLLVVGASVAGVRAAVSARESGFDGTVELIDREPHLPYDRLPLSKAFLSSSGDEVPLLLGQDELDRQGIRFHGGVDVCALDLESRQVWSESEVWFYDSLILAPGAKPVRHQWMRMLDGVSVLRSFGDAVQVKRSLRAARDVVLVGGGFIGGELASYAVGLGKNVTIVDAAPVPLERALGAVVGRRVLALHHEAGVVVLPGEHVTEIVGDGAVKGIKLASGAVIPAQAVVVGAGVTPDTGWLRASGLALNPRDGSIMCDESLQTSDRHVWAAGDAVSWPNSVMGATARYENWSNAAEQGRYAGQAAHLQGSVEPFGTVPYFWTDWYGNRIQMVGCASEDVSVVIDDVGERPRYLALFRDGNRLTGVVAINCTRPVMKLRARIASTIGWEEALQTARALVPEQV